MGDEWSSRGQAGAEVYSPEQVELVLEEIGIEISHDIDTHFICYCPFHNNTDSPAFEVNKTNGWWVCFNPGCGQNSNSLELLITKLTDKTVFQARRLILKHGAPDRATRLEREKIADFEFVPFPVEPVERMHGDYKRSERAINYMHSRGFQRATTDDFQIGYSEKQDSIITPMHDPGGMLVGFIARSVDGKVFKNTSSLPKSKTAWNYHRAKRTGDTVIIVESNFDAMRVHQAGYPNVVALLGGSLSKLQAAQLDKTFNTIIHMADFEIVPVVNNPCATCQYRGFMMCQGHRPGRELAHKIIRTLPHKRHLWAAFDDTCVYPHEAKDASDMTDDEIRQCLHDPVSNYAYSHWGIESLAS